MFPARKDTLIGRRDRAILQAFAKIKHWMRAAQKRTTEDSWRHLGSLLAPSNTMNAATTSPTQDMLPSKDETL